MSYRSILTLSLAASLSLLLTAGARADLLVTSSNGGVLRYDNSGAFLGKFDSGGPTLNEPPAITVGPDGKVYVLSGGNAVYRYDASGAYLNTFVATGAGGINDAKDMKFGPDGNLYVASNNSSNDLGGQVLRYDGATGAFKDVFVASGAGGTSPLQVGEAMSLAFGPDKSLYLGNDARDLNGGNDAYNVLRFNGTTGAFIEAAVPTNDHSLYDPNHLIFGPDGKLYVSHEVSPDSNSGSVLRYNAAGGTFLNQFVTPGSGGIAEPYGLTFGPDHNLYVASGDSNEVKRYDGTTGAFIDTFVTAGSGGLFDPKGLVFVNAVPEPSGLVLLGTGLLGLVLLGRRRVAQGR